MLITLLIITDGGKLKGFAFRPLSKFAFFVFVVNFAAALVGAGCCHVEVPFIELGQVSCTLLYFSNFVVIMPLVSVVENLFIELGSINYSFMRSNKDSSLSRVSEARSASLTKAHVRREFSTTSLSAAIRTKLNP